MDRPGFFGDPCLPDAINLPFFPGLRSSFPHILSADILPGGVQALGVIPVHPFESSEHHVIGPAPRPSLSMSSFL